MSPESIDQVCAELTQLRESGGESARYGELIGKLDAYFWKRAAEALPGALSADGEELSFAGPDKLLLDAGLLDVDLVHRAGRDFLERLGAELGAEGPEGVHYLTEWLGERYRSFLATRTLPDERVGESMLLKAAASEDVELGTSREQRNELYGRVAGLFEKLPGMKPDLAKAIGRGAVDDRVEELLLAQALEDHRAEEAGGEPDASAGRQAGRYDHVVMRTLQQAREHTEDEEDLKYLGAIGNLRMAIFRKSLVHAKRAPPGSEASAEIPLESRPEAPATFAEAETFLKKELRLLRSLLRIGSREGNVDHACSVLLNDVTRTTKGVVGEVLDLVREVDPRIGLSHEVLIAPFTGSGFFEWDRNSLIVALSPARGVEEAVVNAVANFRLLNDARSGSGKIISSYRTMYGSEFRTQFLADYRNWVLRAGRGKRDALSEKSHRFFIENIGPPPGGPIVPHEMARLSVGERQEEIKRLATLVRTGSYSGEEAYRLAVLLWQSERIEEAIRNMEKAVKLVPESGRTLYSLGVLCRRKHLTGAARRAFRDAVRLSPDSLWGIYAHEALRRMV